MKFTPSGLLVLALVGVLVAYSWISRAPATRTTAMGNSRTDLLADNIIQGDFAGLRRALQRPDVRVDQPSSWGITPLGHAITLAKRDGLGTLRLLIEHGADVNQPIDMRATTPLMCAVAIGDRECAQELLRAGADPDESQLNLLGQIDQLDERLTNR